MTEYLDDGYEANCECPACEIGDYDDCRGELCCPGDENYDSDGYERKKYVEYDGLSREQIEDLVMWEGTTIFKRRQAKALWKMHNAERLEEGKREKMKEEREKERVAKLTPEEREQERKMKEIKDRKRKILYKLGITITSSP
jgi:hypothetical protein